MSKHHHKRFSPEQLEKLENDERRRFQPPEPLAEWAAGRRPGCVLDVGVGIGYFALALARALPGARIIGLDVEPRMLEALGERLEREGLAGRVERLAAAADAGPDWDLAAGSCDLVLAVNMLHELDHPAEFVRRAARVLAPGGVLLVVDWDPDDVGEHGPPREHRLAPRAVEELFAGAGLELVERPALYAGFYSLAFGKPPAREP